MSEGQESATYPSSAGYAQVNGLNLYYEIHGTGQPLVLLHGGLLTIDLTFGGILPALAATPAEPRTAPAGGGSRPALSRATCR
ncbi:hypothetical protein ADK86_27535 [Streptomyces sp. NRRL F-5755]|uniref:alpha/beta fold hydrolase n=1 Tax=Streptomyces sp. NRRL F-5755 TaxID=1519475 RepID=UPI0006AF91F8|nr:hypothetical protein [Streptomyces sp. NRRL F-5755]KOT89913.1 hypothetical protein ADK86_27535 [Streptomyces sp. NRRL F-5755]